jgi:hypothetical protein
MVVVSMVLDQGETAQALDFLSEQTRTYLKIDLRRQGSVAFWASDLSNLRNPWKDRGRYPGLLIRERATEWHL